MYILTLRKWTYFELYLGKNENKYSIHSYFSINCSILITATSCEYWNKSEYVYGNEENKYF